MSQEAQDRLSVLEEALTSYIAAERKRLQAQYDFLTNIARRRGGTVGLQDENAEGASKILVNSLEDYIGRPIDP